LRYSEKYPNETLSFAYYNQTSIRLGNGSIAGSIAGLSIALPTYFLTNLFVYRTNNSAATKHNTPTKPSEPRQSEEDHSQAVAGIAILVSYETIFVLASFFMNPYFLTSLVDIAYTTVFGALCSSTLAVYIGMCKSRKERRCFPKRGHSDWKMLELELAHAGCRQILYILSWVGVMLFIAVTFVMLSQGYYGAPRELSSDINFRLSSITGIVWSFAIFLGFFGGIVSQVVLDMADIEKTIRDQWAEKSKRTARAET
jgi:hypothetical protein